MSDVWIFLPPWGYALIITWLGRWGERHWVRRESVSSNELDSATGHHIGAVIFANLVFLSLIPTTVLILTHPMLPLQGARAGLGVAMVAFLMGCVPVRLLEVGREGWDRTLWGLFVDLIRVGGSLTIIGWLVSRI